MKGRKQSALGVLLASVILWLPGPGAPGIPEPAATPKSNASAEREIADVERRRFAAMVASDLETLRDLLAEGLTYTHTTGAVDTKETLLASIASGRIRYEAIEPSDLAVRLLGDGAVVTGRAAMRVATPKERLSFRVRFTEVLARHNGRWQTVVWQATRLPEEESRR